MIPSGAICVSEEGPANALALNKDSTQVVIAGRNVFKVFSIGENEFTEVYNLRVGKNLNLNFSSIDVAWSQIDENTLATAATNGAVVVWNLGRLGRSKQEHVFSDHKRSVNKVSFHLTEPGLLISGSQDGMMKCFDLRMKEVARTFISNTESIRDVQFSPHAAHVLAAVSENGTVQLWDSRRHERPLHHYTAHSGPVFACDWHPQSPWLATASRDKTIKVWDIQARPSLEHTIYTIASVGHVKWRPARTHQLASCALVLDCSVHVWDVRRPHVPLATFAEHRDVTTAIAWQGPAAFLATSRDCGLYRHRFPEAAHPVLWANPHGVCVSARGHVAHAAPERPLALPLAAAPAPAARRAARRHAGRRAPVPRARPAAAPARRAQRQGRARPQAFHGEPRVGGGARDLQRARPRGRAGAAAAPAAPAAPRRARAAAPLPRAGGGAAGGGGGVGGQRPPQEQRRARHAHSLYLHPARQVLQARRRERRLGVGGVGALRGCGRDGLDAARGGVPAARRARPRAPGARAAAAGARAGAGRRRTGGPRARPRRLLARRLVRLRHLQLRQHRAASHLAAAAAHQKYEPLQSRERRGRRERGRGRGRGGGGGARGRRGRGGDDAAGARAAPARRAGGRADGGARVLRAGGPARRAAAPARRRPARAVAARLRGAAPAAQAVQPRRGGDQVRVGGQRVEPVAAEHGGGGVLRPLRAAHARAHAVRVRRRGRGGVRGVRGRRARPVRVVPGLRARRPPAPPAGLGAPPPALPRRLRPPLHARLAAY